MTQFSSDPNLISLDDAFSSAAWRPRKPANGKKPPPFSLRLTRQERRLLVKVAGTRPLGAYIRGRLFDEMATPRQRGRRPVLDHAAIGRALGALGQSALSVNLARITEAAERGALPVTTELTAELHGACKQITAIRAALIAALGLKVED